MKTCVLSTFLYEQERQWLSTPGAGEPIKKTVKEGKEGRRAPSHTTQHSAEEIDCLMLHLIIHGMLLFFSSSRVTVRASRVAKCISVTEAAEFVKRSCNGPPHVVQWKGGLYMRELLCPQLGTACSNRCILFPAPCGIWRKTVIGPLACASSRTMSDSPMVARFCLSW